MSDNTNITDKALEEIKKCSINKEHISIDDDLKDIDLDISQCVSLLNALYQKNVSEDEIEDAKTVKDFLSCWDCSLRLRVYGKEKSDIPTFSKIFFGFWLVFALIWVLNHKTSFGNGYTTISEYFLDKVINVFSFVDSLSSPEGWLSLAIGPENLFSCILIFAAIIAAFICFTETKYIHQPIGAFFTMLIIADDGIILGVPAFNLLWSTIAPLIFIVLTVLGVIFVWFCLKKITPKNSLVITAIQITPFFLWVTICFILTNILR